MAGLAWHFVPYSFNPLGLSMHLSPSSFGNLDTARFKEPFVFSPFWGAHNGRGYGPILLILALSTWMLEGLCAHLLPSCFGDLYTGGFTWPSRIRTPSANPQAQLMNWQQQQQVEVEGDGGTRPCGPRPYLGC